MVRICLPTQRTWVRALVLEDPTRSRAADLALYSTQLLQPTHLEPTLGNEKPRNEKSMHRNWRKPHTATETQCSQKQTPKSLKKEKPFKAIHIQYSASSGYLGASIECPKAAPREVCSSPSCCLLSVRRVSREAETPRSKQQYQGFTGSARGKEPAC